MLERGLTGAHLRQNSISQNIANLDTPNYTAKQVNFKHTLNDALNETKLKANRTNELHVDFSTAKLSTVVEANRSTTYNHNQNIDLEMAELAKNQIYYNAMIDRLNGRFTNLQTVIRGGK